MVDRHFVKTFAQNMLLFLTVGSIFEETEVLFHLFVVVLN